MGGGQDKLITRDMGHVRKDALLHCIRIWAVSPGSSPRHQVSLLVFNSLILLISHTVPDAVKTWTINPILGNATSCRRQLDCQFGFKSAALIMTGSPQTGPAEVQGGGLLIWQTVTPPHLIPVLALLDHSPPRGYLSVAALHIH